MVLPGKSADHNIGSPSWIEQRLVPIWSTPATMDSIGSPSWIEHRLVPIWSTPATVDWALALLGDPLAQPLLIRGTPGKDQAAATDPAWTVPPLPTTRTPDPRFCRSSPVLAAVMTGIRQGLQLISMNQHGGGSGCGMAGDTLVGFWGYRVWRRCRPPGSDWGDLAGPWFGRSRGAAWNLSWLRGDWTLWG